MLVLGIILLVLGYIFNIGLLVTFGWILAVIGLILLLLSFVSNSPLGGRRFY